MPTQLSLSQTAQLMKVSEKSVRRYIKSGRIKAKLIKGEKGYEYRVEKGQLKNFTKPPRGKNSHQVIKKSTKQKNNKKINKVVKKAKNPKRIIYDEPIPNKSLRNNGYSDNEDINIPIAPKVDSISEILEQKIQSSHDYLGTEKNSIDYKLLYERLLVKYEQVLIMIGSLEAQAQNRPSQNNEKVNKLEQDLAKQEEMIMGLYQDLRLYKENDSSNF
jgi:hypothetical protein